MNTKDNFQKVNSMEKDILRWSMDRVIKANGKMVLFMDLEFISGLIIPLIKVSFLKD